MKTANGSMHWELREFARKSGIKELIRVANIICDNVSKGTGLTEKLQAESEILWMNRENCEEAWATRQMTKLTRPLGDFFTGTDRYYDRTCIAGTVIIKKGRIGRAEKDQCEVEKEAAE